MINNRSHKQLFIINTINAYFNKFNKTYKMIKNNIIQLAHL